MTMTYLSKFNTFVSVIVLGLTCSMDGNSHAQIAN